MAMSSYEVVRRTVEFDRPDRLPVHCDTLGISDLHGVGYTPIVPDNLREIEGMDEWGCRWEKNGAVPNMGQIKGHPLEEWSALDHYVFPDPDDPRRYEGIPGQLEAASEQYVSTGIFMLLFERLHGLRGFENTLMDLYTDRARLGGLADKLVEFDLGIIRNLHAAASAKIHGFGFTDDWGTQQALFVDPELWIEFFQPRYKRIFDAAHACGWHVWMHSCGKVNAILDPLIGIGLDVANLMQPQVLSIEETGSRFAGRLCFESLCDIQRTLPFEGPEAIREEAQRLLDHWATPDGGFILTDYGDENAIGANPSQTEAMLRAFREADPWSQAATGTVAKRL